MAQNAFLDGRLQTMKVEAARMKRLDAKATQAEITDYSSIAGSLQWLAVQLHRDVAFECNRISDLLFKPFLI